MSSRPCSPNVLRCRTRPRPWLAAATPENPGRVARGPRARTLNRPMRATRSSFIACVGVAVVVLTQAPASAAPPWWERRIDALVAGHPMSVAVALDGDPLYAHKDWVARPPASNEKLLLSIALLKRLGPDVTIPTRVFATEPVGDHGVLTGDLWVVGHGDPETDAGDMADPERLAARSLTKKLEARGVEVTKKAGLGSPPGGLEPLASLRSDPLQEIMRRMNLIS